MLNLLMPQHLVGPPRLVSFWLNQPIFRSFSKNDVRSMSLTPIPILLRSLRLNDAPLVRLSDNSDPRVEHCVEGGT